VSNFCPVYFSTAGHTSPPVHKTGRFFLLIYIFSSGDSAVVEQTVIAIGVNSFYMATPSLLTLSGFPPPK